MSVLRILFTRRSNPASWMIRYAVPRSRFALARASHCLIADGDRVIEANMLHGVRRVEAEEAMDGLVLVRSVDYQVPDAEAGLSWARSQDGKAYDWFGAFGIAISPDRKWQEDDKWFCFELAAAALVKAGLDVFSDVGHINGEHLLMLNPRVRRALLA